MFASAGNSPTGPQSSLSIAVSQPQQNEANRPEQAFNETSQSNHVTKYQALSSKCQRYCEFAHNKAAEFLLQHLNTLGFFEVMQLRRERPLPYNGLELYGRTMLSSALLNTMLDVQGFLRDSSLLQKQLEEISVSEVHIEDTAFAALASHITSKFQDNIAPSGDEINSATIYPTLMFLAKKFIDVIPCLELAKGMQPFLNFLMVIDHHQKFGFEESLFDKKDITFNEKHHALKNFDNQCHHEWQRLQKHAKALCKSLAGRFPIENLVSRPLNWNTQIREYLKNIKHIEDLLKNPKSGASSFDYLFKSEQMLIHSHAQIVKLKTGALNFLSNYSFFSSTLQNKYPWLESYLRSLTLTTPGLLCDPREISTLSQECNPGLLAQISQNFIAIRQADLNGAEVLKRATKILLNLGLNQCKNPIGQHAWLFDKGQFSRDTPRENIDFFEKKKVTLIRSLTLELLGGRLENGSGSHVENHWNATPQFPLSWIAHVLERYTKEFIIANAEKDLIRPTSHAKNRLPPRPPAAPHMAPSSSQ